MNRPCACLVIVAVALLVGACSSSRSGGNDAARPADAAARADAAPPDAAPPDAVASVRCGDKTCGPAQYCHIKCTCCGVPTDAMPSADYSCLPIPDGCSAADFCSCTQATSGGSCDPGTRSVDIPCA